MRILRERTVSAASTEIQITAKGEAASRWPAPVAVAATTPSILSACNGETHLALFSVCHVGVANRTAGATIGSMSIWICTSTAIDIVTNCVSTSYAAITKSAEWFGTEV